MVRTANLGGGVNHARVAAGFREAIRHYHNTAAQIARVQYHEDEHGVYLTGAMWPDVTDQQVAIARAAAVSGDWRFLPQIAAYDLCGVQLVNTPGFPLIRKVSRTAAMMEYDPERMERDGTVRPVFIGGMGGVGHLAEDDDEPCCDACAARTAAADQRASDVQAAVLELLDVGMLDHLEEAVARIAGL